MATEIPLVMITSAHYTKCLQMTSSTCYLNFSLPKDANVFECLFPTITNYFLKLMKKSVSLQDEHVWK